ncbi:hypothetical protein HY383_03645 [Candidatus Daviesbacteria bacterium]|nr:hypothetical protein [Candidatus Daviesbacteria bacterium]
MIARLYICRNIDKRAEEIKKILASHIGSGNVNHPDVLYFEKDTKLGIAESRKIIDHFSLKPYSAKGRVAVLEQAEDLTLDAQNALLKTLEELPTEAVFILGAASEDNLLPTILSRCQIIKVHSSQFTVHSYNKDIEKLLQTTIEERFEYIEKLKDREQFLYSLTSFFHQKLPNSASFLEKLLQAEGWAKQNVNIRAILEYLMLEMP